MERACIMAKHKYYYEIDILSPGDLAKTFIAAFNGDSDAQALAKITGDWISKVVREKNPNRKPVCLCCTAVCHDDPSWSLAVARPWAKAGGQAIVTAICPDCAAVGDIDRVV